MTRSREFSSNPAVINDVPAPVAPDGVRVISDVMNGMPLPVPRPMEVGA